MKAVPILLAVSFLLPLLPAAAAPQAEGAADKVVLEITGMTWGLWAILVKRSLAGIDGVTDVEVIWKRGAARVTAARTVTDEVLVEAVEKAGNFTGKVVSREPAEPDIE